MTDSHEKTNTDQDSDPVFMDLGDIEELKENIDHSLVYELPTIKTRYISTLLDFMLIILATFGIAALFDRFEYVPDYIRGIIFGFLILLYEPIFISFGCTLGQLIMNIRVRRIKDPERKILFHGAFFRFLTKGLLGWISLISISFNQNKRAIHDFASGSIVIVPKDN